MLNKYSFFLITLLFYAGILSSQDIKKIPDSLRTYTYDQLRGKIFKNSSNSFKKNYIYSRVYLLKGKNEKNIKEIVYGYDLESEISRDLLNSLKYSDSAIFFAKKGFPRAISYLYYNRGNLYYNKKKLKESLNYFLLARNDSTSNTESLQNKINYSIGLIRKTQGNYIEAINIYKKCEENARINNQSNYLIYLFGIAELYNRVYVFKLNWTFSKRVFS